MIPLFKVFMSDLASDKVAEVLKSGYVGEGPKVKEFEQSLRKWFNNPFMAATNSATSAEHLALRLIKKTYNLKEGDEVLATPLTCTASNWPILANNFRIKWVDINPKTFNMDLDDLEAKLSPTTKAVMAVHWGGYPMDLDRLEVIKKMAKIRYDIDLAVIEDCAHALGSTYKNKKIGNHGNYCTFSFQAIKHVTSVDGGVLITPTKREHERAKLIRWYGIDREGERADFRCEEDIEEWGYKFHMNDVNATVGLENMKCADYIIGKHKENAHFYDTALKEVQGVTLAERAPDRSSSFWIYSMLVENKLDFIKCMKEKGILTSQVHERNDKHTCVEEYKSSSPLVGLEEVIPKLISIPVGWWVQAPEREYIVKCIKEGW